MTGCDTHIPSDRGGSLGQEREAPSATHEANLKLERHPSTGNTLYPSYTVSPDLDKLLSDI